MKREKVVETVEYVNESPITSTNEAIILLGVGRSPQGHAEVDTRQKYCSITLRLFGPNGLPIHSADFELDYAVAQEMLREKWLDRMRWKDGPLHSFHCYLTTEGLQKFKEIEAAEADAAAEHLPDEGTYEFQGITLLYDEGNPRDNQRFCAFQNYQTGKLVAVFPDGEVREDIVWPKAVASPWANVP